MLKTASSSTSNCSVKVARILRKQLSMKLPPALIKSSLANGTTAHQKTTNIMNQVKKHAENTHANSRKFITVRRSIKQYLADQCFNNEK